MGQIAVWESIQTTVTSSTMLIMATLWYMKKKVSSVFIINI